MRASSCIRLRTLPDGTTYPETVLLRLVTFARAAQRETRRDRGWFGFSLGGEADPTHVAIGARGGSASVKLVNKDGQQQLIKP